MLSYWEFQLPAEPSVGSHAGKQSKASSKVMFRMITLSMPFTYTLAPTSVASLPSPTIVVFGVTVIRTRFCWFPCDALRAVSCVPLGTFFPQGPAGSYAVRYALSEYGD